ncbi:dihydrofolate reductase [Roseimicrobium gellanilyticum]|uniref:Dihydrofolate reductase n=1 Tax=Roseimicrobium gellanilyticum TaxID=748857 RepID=A0A366HKF4_9BACT|nr:dihydrofolate reductase [Roseimicrobium gellanilyticum]RBP42590.1 dihydrofolate reductase [Roseimicrobium gellanilyticum]
MPPSPPLPELIAVVAMASNRVIGRDGKLPWHLPEDLKFFKRTTLGHPVLMGRRTFESILTALGKPLPGRLNLVLSHTMEPREDVTVIRDVADIASMPGVKSPVYLIGGAQLYGSLLPQCSELILTYIEQPYEGDAYFPDFEHLFKLKEVLGQGEGFEFRRYVRKAG